MPATYKGTINHPATRATRSRGRRLIPPSSCPCSLAPSVTAPLYSATVSQALRQTLRRWSCGPGANENTSPQWREVDRGPTGCCHFASVHRRLLYTGGIIVERLASLGRGPSGEAGQHQRMTRELHAWHCRARLRRARRCPREYAATRVAL